VNNSVAIAKLPNMFIDYLKKTESTDCVDIEYNKFKFIESNLIKKPEDDL